MFLLGCTKFNYLYAEVEFFSLASVSTNHRFTTPSILHSFSFSLLLLNAFWLKTYESWTIFW